MELLSFAWRKIEQKGRGTTKLSSNQSNNFISVHFSVDTGKYLFTKIYVLVNEMKCFLFLGGVMFKIFWGSEIPVTTGGFCTGSGVIKIEVREVFLYYYIFILLFQGSVMVVHMLILYSWYLSSVKIPPFLGAKSQQRWTKPFLKTIEYYHCSRINQQCQSTTNTKFWTKIF